MANSSNGQSADLQHRAEHLAKLPYSIVVEPDECDGRLCYIARHPELTGCMAQGWTPEEAVSSLREARQMCILSYLKYGQQVPLPHAEDRLQALAQIAA